MFSCYIISVVWLVIVNRCHDVNMYTLYPWVHQYCNNMSNADQIRPIEFPDVSPTDMPPNSNFSMAAGDFLEVYEDAGMLYLQLCALCRIKLCV